MRNAGLDKAQAGIKIVRRNINNLRYADDTTLMAESEELKSLLMKVKEKSGKVGLELNIRKTKIMASGPITSWQIDAKEWKQWQTLFSGSFQIHYRWCLSSVQFSHSVVSNSLQTHESQHARPPYPSPTPGVHSDSRPSNQWCHPAISPSVVSFSCPQSLVPTVMKLKDIWSLEEKLWPT